MTGAPTPGPPTDACAPEECPRPPAEVFDVALLDLDGVVYVGPSAVPHAAEALAAVADRGMRLAFVTNNALRRPETVAEHLVRLGVPARASDVVTSAQAAARMLAGRLPAGAKVLVVGGEGLEHAVRAAGLTVVRSADDDPSAVVQGYDPRTCYGALAEAALAVGRGAFWVAANRDVTVPSPRGPLPGNGSLVALVAAATGATPAVAGKPERALHEESVRRSGAHRPLIVGDRLDTDIEGARRVGTPSLLVLTGVTAPRDLLGAVPVHRPSFLAPDLRGLLRPHPQVRRDGDDVRCRRWSGRAQGDELLLTGPSDRAAAGPGAEEHGPRDEDGLDALRVACALSWSLPAPPGGWHVRGAPEALMLG